MKPRALRGPRVARQGRGRRGLRRLDAKDPGAHGPGFTKMGSPSFSTFATFRSFA